MASKLVFLMAIAQQIQGFIGRSGILVVVRDTPRSILRLISDVPRARKTTILEFAAAARRICSIEALCLSWNWSMVPDERRIQGLVRRPV